MTGIIVSYSKQATLNKILFLILIKHIRKKDHKMFKSLTVLEVKNIIKYYFTILQNLGGIALYESVTKKIQSKRQMVNGLWVYSKNIYNQLICSVTLKNEPQPIHTSF